MERLGNGDCVLPGHRVDDKERVVRVQYLRDLPDLIHQLGVDGESAGRIADDHVATQTSRLSQACLRNIDGSRRLAENGHVDLCTQRSKLLDRRRPLEVGADQKRVAALRFEQVGQFGRVRCLARSLQPGHQDDGWRFRGERDGHRLATKALGQFFENDLDDLLGGVQRLVEFITNGTLANATDEALDHLEIDVGFEQCQTDLAKSLVDVGLAQPPLAPKPPEDPVELIS